MILFKRNINVVIKLKIIFLILYVFIDLFINNKELIFPYYFQGSFINDISFIFFISALILVFRKTLYIDIISLILLIRLLIYLIPLFFTNNTEGYLGNYLAIVASFITYIVSSQSHCQNRNIIENKVNHILFLFLNIASIQVIYLFFLLNNKYGSLSINLFKYYLVTPVGSSNYIASIVLPLLIFIYFSNMNKNFKSISLVVALVALIMIKSKNAILVLLIFMLYRFSKFYINNLKKNINSKNDKQSFMILFSLILYIICGVTFFYIAKIILATWNMGFVYKGTSINDIINALSSNRLNIYKSELTRWTNHFLIGNGLGYKIGDFKSHNWLIDLLAQSGIVGLLAYLSTLFFWLKDIYQFRYKNKLIMSCYYSIIIIFFQGFAEVSLFTISVNVLLWYLIGLSVAEVNCLKSKNNTYHK